MSVSAKHSELVLNQLARAQERLEQATRRRDDARRECEHLDELVDALADEVAGWQSMVSD